MTAHRPTLPPSLGPLAAAGDPGEGGRSPGRRKPWRDPRFALGVVLVAGAAALGSWAVDSAADTQELYALAVDVAPGTDLTQEGVLTVVSSHPGTGSYVGAGELPAHAVATRSMKAGELLPAAGVSQGTDTGMRAVVLPVSTGLPKGVGVGDQVDLWLLARPQTGKTEAAAQQARMVAGGLIVSTLVEQDKTLVGGSQEREIEVLVPAAVLPEVLGALADGGALVLVPVGAGA